MTLTAAPTTATVTAIVAGADPVLRNLRITQGYHDLSRGMLAVTGGAGINWCTLGTWASKTAGRFIRDEEVPAAFRGLLARSLPFAHAEARTSVRGLMDVASNIVSDVSAYIMEGNRVVFEELAGVFAAFLADVGRDAAYDAGRLAAFQQRLEPGEPEPDEAWFDEGGHIRPRRRGGQGLLQQMCAAYYEAMFERNPKRRAELLLIGNGCGGLHEQTRLQTYIAGSLNAPVADTLIRHGHDHAPSTDAMAIVAGSHRRRPYTGAALQG